MNGLLLFFICKDFYYLIFRSTEFNLNEFRITDNELKLMAAAAIIGDKRIPKNGYNNPAATGTPKTL